MKETLLKYKKKIIITVVTVTVLSVGAVGTYFGMGYNYAKNNENYSEKEIREIATEQTKGEITNIHKEFEIEDDNLSLSQFEYTVEIKTPDNKLQEVEVSSRTGTVDIDNDDDMND